MLLFDHVRDAPADHVERAVKVDSNDGVPLLLAHVEDHPVAEDSGSVDEYVESAELVERGLNDLAG